MQNKIFWSVLQFVLNFHIGDNVIGTLQTHLACEHLVSPNLDHSKEYAGRDIPEAATARGQSEDDR